MDFFTPIVAKDKLHPNFLTVTDGRHRTPQQQLFNHWADGFPDRDNKLVKEFQTTFNSTFWEVYLYALFTQYGFKFDWGRSTPDFHVQCKGVDIIVEATTASNAKGKVAEWENYYRAGELKSIKFNELNREATIRLANAFMSKVRRYQQKYCHLDHVKNKPFILAIAPFEQPVFGLQYNRPIMSLLYDRYVNEDAYLENPSKYPSGPPVEALGTVEKDNGAEIELGFFLDGGFPEVSAVIFSTTATWGKLDVMAKSADTTGAALVVRGDAFGLAKPQKVMLEDYSEDLLDGIQVYHNPFAKHPIPESVFDAPGVVQVVPDHINEALKEIGTEGSLMTRTVLKISKKEPDK